MNGFDTVAAEWAACWLASAGALSDGRVDDVEVLVGVYRGPLWDQFLLLGVATVAGFVSSVGREPVGDWRFAGHGAGDANVFNAALEVIDGAMTTERETVDALRMSPDGHLAVVRTLLWAVQRVAGERRLGVAEYVTLALTTHAANAGAPPR